MILNTTWLEDRYAPESTAGGGHRFFLGGAALSDISPVFVTGGVETGEEWLLFTVDFGALATDVPGESFFPQTVAEALEFFTDPVDPVMAVILADAPGWEWDVVDNALTTGTGLIRKRLPRMSQEQAKDNLRG